MEIITDWRRFIFPMGSDEVLYVVYEIIKNRLEECGIKVISKIGENLYHCYPLFHVV